MMVGKEDVGLSLSLGPGLSIPPRHHFLAMPHWPTDLARGRLRGIDVNRPPPPAGDADEEEDAAGAASSSPNSAASSVLSGGAGKRDHGESYCSDEDGDGSRKKLRLSKDQSAVLEESFKEHNTLNQRRS